MLLIKWGSENSSLAETWVVNVSGSNGYVSVNGMGPKMVETTVEQRLTWVNHSYNNFATSSLGFCLFMVNSTDFFFLISFECVNLYSYSFSFQLCRNHAQAFCITMAT